jgi:anti-sigma factor RsiW
MKHEDCSRLAWVNRLHDGELSEAERAQVESHLRGCEQCQAELEGLGRLSTQLLAMPAAPTLSGDSMSRLHEQAEQHLAMADQSLRRFAEILSGLAAAVLIMSSVWLMRAGDVAAAEPVAPWEAAAASLRAPVAAPSPSLNTARLIVTELERRHRAGQPHD